MFYRVIFTIIVTRPTETETALKRIPELSTLSKTPYNRQSLDQVEIEVRCTREKGQVIYYVFVQTFRSLCVLSSCAILTRSKVPGSAKRSSAPGVTMHEDKPWLVLCIKHLTMSTFGRTRSDRTAGLNFLVIQILGHKRPTVTKKERLHKCTIISHLAVYLESLLTW